MINSNKIEIFQAPKKKGNVQSEVVSSSSKGGKLRGGERSEGCLGDLCFVWKTASPDRYGILKEFAQENRNNITEAENALWLLLSNKKLGVKFLRQYIIGDYIVDFICRELQLIIEVDGGYHSEPRQQESDLQRENYLHEKGYRVLRFNNEEILFDLEKVINIIKQNL